MVYSADMKRLAMKLVYVDKRSDKEIVETLLISLSALRSWKKLNSENKLYQIKPRLHVGRKIDDDGLKAYILKYPDAYLYEIAKVFNVSKSGIHDAIKRLGINYKKNSSIPREKTRRAV